MNYKYDDEFEWSDLGRDSRFPSGWWILPAFLLGFALLVIFGTYAFAAEKCPEGAASCKVLILTPQEEQFLMAPNGILSTAAQARKLDLETIANYLAERIKAAPAGEVVKKEEPKAPVPAPKPKP